MRGAIGITTYYAAETRRAETTIKSIESLLSSDFEGSIFVVDDGSAWKGHLDALRAIGSTRIEIVERATNGGVSRAKNTCLRLCMESGADLAVLADDDMEYVSPAWFSVYADCMQSSGIHHMVYSCYEHHRHKHRSMKHNGVDVVNTENTNGCLLFATRALVDRIGYFKVMTGKHGYEHVNYTRRAVRSGMAPYVADVPGSHELVRLMPCETTIPRGTPEFERNVLQNQREYLRDMDAWHRCEE